MKTKNLFPTGDAGKGPSPKGVNWDKYRASPLWDNLGKKGKQPAFDDGVEYPTLPKGIPEPREGWVYVGGGWRERNDSNEPIIDIAHYWEERKKPWDYTGWWAEKDWDGQHYAVRIGSDAHKEWVAWKKQQQG